MGLQRVSPLTSAMSLIPILSVLQLPRFSNGVAREVITEKALGQERAT